MSRVNWNVANNGSCVELKYSDGTVAKFLHLSDVSVKPGTSVSAGTTIGLTGNTGHSTAPHLHYELEKNGRTIDPVDYHGVFRRTLDSADMGRFADERDRMAAVLASSGA